MTIRSETDCFPAEAIAIWASLPRPVADTRWMQWADELSEDQIELLRGRLTSTFGRIDIPKLPKDSRSSVLIHLRILENEYLQWLKSPGELLDFALALRCAELSSSRGPWYWSAEHQRLWQFRGRACDIAPSGIRLIPLTGCSSTSELFERELTARIHLFGTQLQGDTAAAREKLIGHVESGCSHMHLEVEEVFGSFLTPLRQQRRISIPETVSANPHALRRSEALNEHLVNLSSVDYLQQHQGIALEIHHLSAQPSGPATADFVSSTAYESWRDVG
jgi:hypothetical protein